MAAARARELLLSCDPQLLDVRGDSDSTDSVSVDLLLKRGDIEEERDRRRVQKVLWRQLFVLDSMMSLMEELKSARQLLTTPCPTPPDAGARSRWKRLKLQYKTSSEETEALLHTQLLRIQQIEQRRQTITHTLHTAHTRSAHRGALQAALLKAHHALRQSEDQLLQLLADAEVTLDHMIAWEQIRDDLQVEVSLVQDVMEMKILSLSPSELSLEISPSPGLSPEPGPGPGLDSDLLRLTVKWGPDDTFSLRVGADAVGLVDWSGSRSGSRSGSGSWPWSQLRSVLLELLQNFRGQAELLSEIQTLRSRFAIDWCPAQRLLVFLKSASVVCELQVEEAYPTRGGVKLLSVQREGRSCIPDIIQNQENLSLTQWLLLLSSSPEI